MVFDVARRRLRAQRISGAPFARAEQAVAWLGAVQAQDYFGALWAVGLRLTRATEADVERASTERRIVRTWPMRGTLHFVAAADARWMTELLSRRPLSKASSRLRSYGIDGKVLTRARRVIVRNLSGGRQLTRPELYRALESASIPTSGERGLHILWCLAQDCVLCFGPRRSKQQTFVLFDEWLPKAKSLPRAEALAALAQRYFASHGPATLHDFAWWSGLTLAEAREGLELAREKLVEERMDGEHYWLADAAPNRVSSRPDVHVLPAFDEFLVGYADRSAAVDRTDSARVMGGGLLHPTVVADGRVLGTWKRRTTRREVYCSVTPFTPLGRARAKDLKLALERYARFLRLDLATGRSR